MKGFVIQHTPHERPHAGDKLDDLALDAGICALPKGRVI